MVGRTKRPTKAEAERMAALSGMLCIACMLGGTPTCARVEVHHLFSGNRRRGHIFTIPLCAWHHRGDPGDSGARYMEKNFGPSLARSSKRFHAAFGSDDRLLEATNRKLQL